MKINAFEWDERNLEHIARHQVDPDEIEDVCGNRPFVLKGKDGLYLIYGRTDSGRLLLVVTRYRGQGILRVITARDMTHSERKLYRRK